MTSPQLPQPIYPGGPSAEPAAGSTSPGSPSGPIGYAPITPARGGPPGGAPGGPGGRGPDNRRWLMIGGGALAAVAVVVTVVLLGQGGGAGQQDQTQSAQTQDTQTQDAQTQDAGGGSGTGTPDGSGSTSDTGQDTGAADDLSAVVTDLWGSFVTGDEQSCLVDAATADPSLGTTMSAWSSSFGSARLSQGEATSLAQASVDCLSIDSRQTMAVQSTITPWCPSYDGLSQLTDADWTTYLADFYLTLDGVYTLDDYAYAYFDMSVCTYDY